MHPIHHLQEKILTAAKSTAKENCIFIFTCIYFVFMQSMPIDIKRILNLALVWQCFEYLVE